MKIDLDTEIHAHLKHIDQSIEEIESNCGSKGFTSDMDNALEDLKSAKDRFFEAWAESKRHRDNL